MAKLEYDSKQVRELTDKLEAAAEGYDNDIVYIAVGMMIAEGAIGAKFPTADDAFEEAQNG